MQTKIGDRALFLRFFGGEGVQSQSDRGFIRENWLGLRWRGVKSIYIYIYGERERTDGGWRKRGERRGMVSVSPLSDGSSKEDV